MIVSSYTCSPRLTSILSVLWCPVTVTPEPKDETVFLGSTSHFACGRRGSSLEWKVNGTILTDELRLKFKESSVSNLGFNYSTLQIPGEAEYNGTKVQCVSGDDKESNLATMYVQGNHIRILFITFLIIITSFCTGTLSAVVNITVRVTEDNVIVFWTAPFSLNVSHLESDIWYSLFVRDNTGQKQIDCINCTNFTETNYTFTGSLEQCHEYTLAVKPWNGAGEGVTSHKSFLNEVSKSELGE